MLNDLRHYDNLGTPNYFFQLLSTLSENQKTEWKLDDVNQLFYNKIIDGRRVFDGCVDLALKIDILYIEKEHIFVDEKISKFLNNESQIKDRFIKYLFKALKEDDSFHQIFNSKYLSYDVIYKSFQISNSAFGFRFANFRQLLLDFDAIKHHPTPEINNFIVNSRFRKIFDKTVLPEIKKRKIGVDEFKQSIEKQQIYGEEAEKFVLDFEVKRLNGKEKIEWVAEYVVNAGYDIASYDDEKDNEHNRFIEVKSYAGNRPYFYWSRNEYNVAKRRKENYWLYLVNRNKIGEKDYVPLMEQNPYESVLQNGSWNKQIEKYKIEWYE